MSLLTLFYQPRPRRVHRLVETPALPLLFVCGAWTSWMAPCVPRLKLVVCRQLVCVCLSVYYLFYLHRWPGRYEGNYHGGKYHLIYFQKK